jgi:hypothetical protein
MARKGDTLSARLPHQPPAGKLEYSVRLAGGGEQSDLPPSGFVVIRFKGDVPTWLLIIHIVAMFLGMLISTRTGLAFFEKDPPLSRRISWTIVLLFVGGFILGPLVQKYAFDAYWTGWPSGSDLTDNKTAVALLAWVVVALMVRRSAQPKRWALGAAVILLVVYMIPHSLLGSQLDYSKMPKAPSEQQTR